MQLKKCSPVFIVVEFLLMLPAIQLNHNVLFDTGKIGNISSDRVLAPESMSIQLLAPQSSPEQPLGVSHAAAQRSRP